MRAVVQRVRRARVQVGQDTVGSCGPGILVYLGVGRADTPAEAERLAVKVANLRIFEDANARMSRSVLQGPAAALVVSQFTLFGDVRKGRRPSFEAAAAPPAAEGLYLEFCDALRKAGVTVATGRFRAEMLVDASVDGPVTILVDTDRNF